MEDGFHVLRGDLRGLGHHIPVDDPVDGELVQHVVSGFGQDAGMDTSHSAQFDLLLVAERVEDFTFDDPIALDEQCHVLNGSQQVQLLLGVAAHLQNAAQPVERDHFDVDQQMFDLIAEREVPDLGHGHRIGTQFLLGVFRFGTGTDEGVQIIVFGQCHVVYGLIRFGRE